MENQEFTFDPILTRRFSFGEAIIAYTDNGNKRKAELRYKGKRICHWEGDDSNKWIASALCDFTRTLRTVSFDAEANYSIFCCIGYAMAEKNVGRYWHEYNHPNEIAAAIATCQSRSMRMFNVPGNKLQEYTKTPPQRSLADGQSHTVAMH